MTVIEQAKILQLLRSDVKTSKKEAIGALDGVISAFGTKNFDGAPLVVRYQDGDEVKSLFVIFHKLADNTTGYTVFDNSSEAEAALQEVKDAIVANKVDSTDGTVVVTPTAATDDEPAFTNLSVNVDGLTIVKATKGENKGKISTAVKIQYVAAVPAAEGTEAVPAHIALIDNAKTELSTVAVSDLIGNGVLDHSSYDKATGILSLFFKQADGTMKEEKVDLKDMLDLNDVLISTDSTKYLKVTPVETIDHYEDNNGNTISIDGYAELDEEAKSAYHAVYSEKGIELGVKMGVVTTVLYTKSEIDAAKAIVEAEDYEKGSNPEAEKVAAANEGDVKTVSATTGLADAENVAFAMTDAVEALEAEIEKLEAESLTGVTVNGHLATPTTPGNKTDVAVTINGQDIEVASAYTPVVFAADFAAKLGENATVVANDKVSAALAKVENEVKVLVKEVLDNEEVTEKAIESLAEAAGLTNSEGVITYTVHTQDSILSGATSLDSADVALANEIRKVEAKSSTVVDALTGNTATLGANITSTEDAVTKATTYHVDVNYDFGSFTL